MIPAVHVSTQIATHLAMQSASAEKRLITALRENGAVDRRSAIPLSVRGGHEASRLEALIRVGAIVQTPQERYYLDEAAVAGHYARQRRAIRNVCGGVAVIAALAVALIAWMT